MLLCTLAENFLVYISVTAEPYLRKQTPTGERGTGRTVARSAIVVLERVKGTTDH